MANLQINLAMRLIQFQHEKVAIKVMMQQAFFDNIPVVEDISQVSNHYENILKMYTTVSKKNITVFRNPYNTILSCKIGKNDYTEESTTMDFDLEGFLKIVDFLDDVSEDAIPHALIECFERFAINKPNDTIIVINGQSFDLKAPDKLCNMNMPPIEIINRCKMLRKNYNVAAFPGILETLESNAVKDVLLTESVTYQYHITGFQDVLSIKLNDEILISIAIEQIAYYGINIVNILNERLSDLEFFFQSQPIAPECGIAHLYFPERFKGNEPISVRHYAAFGDVKGLIQFIEKTLNSLSKFKDKQDFLNRVDIDLLDCGIDLSAEIDEYKHAINQYAQAQASKSKSLDDMLVPQKEEERDITLYYN